MVRYVSNRSGKWLKNALEDVYDWWNGNKDFVSTQIPYYSDYLNFEETAQFWRDYKKNTGFSPRYPRRAYGDSGSRFYRSVKGLGRDLKKLYG